MNAELEQEHHVHGDGEDILLSIGNLTVYNLSGKTYYIFIGPKEDSSQD